MQRFLSSCRVFPDASSPLPGFSLRFLTFRSASWHGHLLAGHQKLLGLIEAELPSSLAAE
jgi:hypothetical protein